MPVINTYMWIETFGETCVKEPLRDPYFAQCETVCKPLERWFPLIGKEELQYHMLTFGLFEPDEWEAAIEDAQKMKKRKMWEILKNEYKRLKKRWKGPEVSIFIFPISHFRTGADKNKTVKNGVSFEKAVILFFSPNARKEEIKAAFAHEYNHVCRLLLLKEKDIKMTLKEAVVLEGLGEYAVKELYSERWLAPWVHLYSYEEACGIWENQFTRSLGMDNKEVYDAFLYGTADQALPRWIGYHIGYHIIDSYQSVRGPFKKDELYKKSSDELIRGSRFPWKE